MLEMWCIRDTLHTADVAYDVIGPVSSRQAVQPLLRLHRRAQLARTVCSCNDANSPAGPSAEGCRLRLKRGLVASQACCCCCCCCITGLGLGKDDARGCS